MGDNPSTTNAPLPGSVGEGVGTGVDIYKRYGPDGLAKDIATEGPSVAEQIEKIEQSAEYADYFDRLNDAKQNSGNITDPEAWRKPFRDFYDLIGDGIDLLPDFIGKDAFDRTIGELARKLRDRFESPPGDGGDGGSGGDEEGTSGSYPPPNPPQPRDPLVLDLNGDGVHLVAPATNGAYFDIDNDGFREQVGWLSGGDGFLVRDLNGDGAVNNASELFGSTTKTGHQDLATSDSDRNGIIDQDDLTWASLQVWIDSNGDGESATSELHDLSSFGITSISLSTTSARATQPGGQIIVSSEVASAGQTLQAYSVNLSTNQTLTQEVLPDDFQMDLDTYLLPNLMGFGHLSDLRVAMTRDEALKQQVKDFVSKDRGATFQSYTDDALNILFAWAGVTDVEPQSRGSDIDARKVAVVEKLVDIAYPQNLSAVSGIGAAITEYFESFFDAFVARLLGQVWESNWMLRQVEDPLALLRNEILFDPLVLLSGGRITDGRHLSLELSNSIAGLGAAQGEDSPLDQEQVNQLVIPGLKLLIKDKYGSLAAGESELIAELSSLEGFSLAEIGSGWSALHNGTHIVGTTEGETFSNVTDARFVEAGAGNDMIEAGGRSSILDGQAGDDTIQGSESADWILGSTGHDRINGGGGNDVIVGGTGNDEVGGGSGNDIYRFSLGDGQDRIHEAESRFTSGGSEKLVFGLGISVDDLLLTKPASNFDDLLIGIVGTSDSVLISEQDVSYQGRYYNRIESFVFQTLEADGSIRQTVVSEAELQTLRIARATTSGNDTIVGSSRGDAINGADGDDKLYGWSGDDSLTGGTGNDFLAGGSGSDTYYFGVGGGQDRISEEESSFSSGGMESLVFDLGIRLEDLLLTKPASNFDDLLIGLVGTSDSILISGQDVSYQGRYYNRIESFVFQTLEADGSIRQTVVSEAELQTLRIARATTSGNDTIVGSSRGDAINGADGDDKLYGWSGDDSLTGGTGNDFLAGGSGSDTYYFGVGGGQDRISEEESSFSSGGMESLVFDVGIRLEDLILTKPSSDTNDLLIQLAGTTDSILIDGQDVSYQGRFYNRVEKFIFQVRGADGSISETVLTSAQIDAHRLAVSVTEGDDTINGSPQPDQLYGAGGNDILKGSSGNDHLQGGLGNDYLEGSSGNDVYRFNLGDGQDRIYEAESRFSSGGTEYLVFGPGISIDDLVLTKPGSDWNDLRIQIAGTSDSILLDDQDISYQGRYYNRIEQFVFQTQAEDGSIIETSISEADLQALRVARSTTAGDDVIVGSVRTDTMEGRGGNDTLYGWSGDDLLVGGLGNDTLQGGSGNDTYRFNLGDGQDRIYEAEDRFSSGGTERLVFGPGISIDDIVVSTPTSDAADLLIQIDGTSDSILIDDQNISYQGRFYNRIEQFVFQTQNPDGSIYESTLTAAQLQALVSSQPNSTAAMPSLAAASADDGVQSMAALADMTGRLDGDIVDFSDEKFGDGSGTYRTQSNVADWGAWEGAGQLPYLGAFGDVIDNLYGSLKTPEFGF